MRVSFAEYLIQGLGGNLLLIAHRSIRFGHIRPSSA
jgi:hypothetical protein